MHVESHGGNQDDAHPEEEACKPEDRQLHLFDLDARQVCRFRISTDCVDVTAEIRLVENEPRESDQNGHDECRKRHDTEDGSLPDIFEGIGQVENGLLVGEDVRDARIDGHGSQGDHERIEPESDGNVPVEKTQSHDDQHSLKDGYPNREVPPDQACSRNHAANAQFISCSQIDTAPDHQDGHADGNDDQIGVLPEKIQNVRHGEKLWVQNTEDGNADEEYEKNDILPQEFRQAERLVGTFAHGCFTSDCS